MNATTKLSIAAACLIIADKLGQQQRNKEQAVQRQQFQDENQEIANLTERYLAAADLLLKNYRLRDAHEQEVRNAINLIKDSRAFALNQNKRINLEFAKEKILRVYNAVK